MRLICDTNVWYDIAAGRRNPATLKSEGRKLLVTPVSFIEIVSELTDDNFAQRSAAAQAVVSFADEQVLDPERHFAEMWGLAVPPLNLDWMGAFKALANAPNLMTLRAGVPDHAAGVIRTVRPEVAALLRTHWGSFARDIEGLVDQFFHGYLVARKTQQAKYVNAATAKPFHDATRLPEIEKLVAIGTRTRAALNLPTWTLVKDPTTEEVDRVGTALRPYVQAYARYVYKCATAYTPKPNDWGDLECFAYLQGDRRLLTRDGRWIEIALEAGLSDWLFDPELGACNHDW